jgi:bacterial/archaeal transporter family-2 protein
VTTLLLILAAMTAAAGLPIQAGLNAQLRTHLPHPLTAALVSFLVGTAAIAVAMAVARVPASLGAALQTTSWWHWLGGTIGAVNVLAAILLAPRLGATTLIASIVAGQLVASVMLDHYGLAGFARQPLTPWRALGAGLVFAGVLLIRR